MRKKRSKAATNMQPWTGDDHAGRIALIKVGKDLQDLCDLFLQSLPDRDQTGQGNWTGGKGGGQDCRRTGNAGYSRRGPDAAVIICSFLRKASFVSDADGERQRLNVTSTRLDTWLGAQLLHRNEGDEA